MTLKVFKGQIFVVVLGIYPKISYIILTEFIITHISYKYISFAKEIRNVFVDVDMFYKPLIIMT